MAKQNVEKKLEDVEVPFSDVKNVLEEIHFEDEATRSRCRGWLVLPSRKYLQADILFPGCEFDCRLTIRGRTGIFGYKWILDKMLGTFHVITTTVWCPNLAQYSSMKTNLSIL